MAKKSLFSGMKNFQLKSFSLSKYTPGNMQQFKKYILYNKFVLYLLFFLTCIQLLAFILQNRFDLFALLSLFLASLFYFYSKNLVVVLGLGLIAIKVFQFILHLFGFKEGLQNNLSLTKKGDEKEKSKGGYSVKIVGLVSLNSNSPSSSFVINHLSGSTTINKIRQLIMKSHPTYSISKYQFFYHPNLSTPSYLKKANDSDTLASLGFQKSSIGVLVMKIPSSSSSSPFTHREHMGNFNDQENDEELQYETAAPRVGASDSMKDMDRFEHFATEDGEAGVGVTDDKKDKDKTSKDINYTKTMTDNLSMYNDLLESDGFAKMTEDTQKLMIQQERLSQSLTQFMPLISQMTPFLEKANGLLQGVDLNSMNKLSSAFSNIQSS